MSAANPSLDQARAYLDALDLRYIIRVMCSSQYPLPRWTEADAQHCAQLYKNFLWLNKKYLPQPLVPTREIDEFWHNHILYTKQYMHDCQAIFGFYFHHAPSSPDENPEILVDNFVTTRRLYLAEFNQALVLERKIT